MRSTLALALLVPAVSLLALSPAEAARTCLAQTARPQAEPRAYQPVNGTGGFSVFGSDTLARSGFYVGLGYLGEEAICQDRDGDLDLSTVWLALAYGITDRFQVGVDVPYSWYTADKARFEGDGLDDVNFGLVYRLVDEAPGQPGLALVGFAAAPTADQDKGLGREDWDLGVKAVLTKTLPGGPRVHLNAGYTGFTDRAPEDVKDQLSAGAALEWPLGRHLSLVGEGLVSTNWRPVEERQSTVIAEARGGVRVRAAGFLLSLAGRAGLTNDAPDWGIFALLSYTFGPGLVGAPGPGAAPGAPPAAPGAPVGPGVAAPAVPGAPAAPGAPAVPGAPTAPGAPAGPGVAAPAVPGAPGAPAAPAVPGAPTAPGAPAAPAVPGAPTAPGAPAAPGAPVGPPGVAAVPPAALPGPVRSVLRDIHFEFDRYEVTPEARRTLEELADALRANAQFGVLVEGHADERGTTEYNLALGQRRAQAAKDYLVSLGIAADRIDTISYGEERPLDPGDNELAWALNRRGHFIVRTGR